MQPLVPKVLLKELVCNDQGFKCATKIPVAGSNCIINSGLVGVRTLRMVPPSPLLTAWTSKAQFDGRPCYAESSALAIQEQCPLNHLACSCSDGSIDEHGLGKPPSVTPPAAFHPYVHPAGENGRGLLRGSLTWQACIFPSEVGQEFRLRLLACN